MRITLVTVAALLAASTAAAQPDRRATADSAVRAAIRELIRERNEAARRHDRAALERVYAEEFLFIHTNGGIDDREDMIAGILTIDSPTPIAPPRLDDLLVYGDVAVYRDRDPTARGPRSFRTTIYARENSRWRIVHLQGTMLPPELAVARVAPEVLDGHVGRYAQASGSRIAITRSGDTLFIQGDGRPRLALTPTSDSTFVTKYAGELAFHRDAARRTTHLVLRQPGNRDVRGDRVP